LDVVRQWPAGSAMGAALICRPGCGHVQFSGLILENLNLRREYPGTVPFHLHDVQANRQMHNQFAGRCADPVLTIDGHDGIGWSKAKRKHAVARRLDVRLLSRSWGVNGFLDAVRGGI
jgi:hypothetical protein